MTRLSALSAAGLALAAILCGCSREAVRNISGPADLKGCRIAHMSSDFHKGELLKLQPDLVFAPYSEYAFAVESLRQRKIDAISIGRTYADIWLAKFPGEFRIAFEYATDTCAFLLPKGSPLKPALDREIRKMRDTGELAAIQRRWRDGACAGETPKVPAFPPPPAGAREISVASAAQAEPWCFVAEDGLAGVDIEVLATVAARLGWRLETKTYNWGGMVDAVNASRCDIANGGIYTGGQEFPTVDTSEKYADERMCILVLNKGKTPAAGAGEVRTPHDLVGKKVGAMTGSTIQSRTEAYQPGLVYLSFNDYNSGVEALRRGKIDAMPLEKMMAEIWLQRCPGEFRISDVYIDNPMGYICRKGSPLQKDVDAILKRMEADGELARLYRKWCSADARTCVPEQWPTNGFTGKNGTLRFAVDGEHEPLSFVTSKGIEGFDVDVARRIAIGLDRKLQLVQVCLSSLVIAVQEGKADLGGYLSITEERRKVVDFTVPTVRGGYVLLLPSGRKSADGTKSFFESLRASFVRTFVTEARWRMVGRGLGVTLLITFLAALFGTLLAFPVWRTRTSKVRFVARCARGYVAFLQGTPLLVLLLVLFYIVFGQADVDGLWIAVLGFSLNASAYIGEMLRSGIESVPRGQTEAALALGYRPRRAFFRFVLPQAVRAILPVYRGQLIGMLKNTSIVGYIAINDLTKASDLIRSRTYESFFPILTTAFVYIVLSWLLAFTLDRLGRRLTPTP